MALYKQQKHIRAFIKASIGLTYGASGTDAERHVMLLTTKIRASMSSQERCDAREDRLPGVLGGVTRFFLWDHMAAELLKS